MQKCVVAAFKPLLAVALLGAVFVTSDIASSDPLPQTNSNEASVSNCDPDNVVVYEAGQVPEADVACASDAQMLTADRDYLVDTATPGSTMVRQGPEVAIGRLHPEFVRRLAAAIREARQAGLPSVGIFSAYRPPAFGVGGFSDKFNSLHSYGLAVDMSGIGGAGSAEARLWYEIAARHGVTCPYGFENRVEWNHCQPTRIKLILPENPLRETVTASGPIDLDSMFEAGNSMIESPESVAAASAAATEAAAAAHPEMISSRPGEQAAGVENAGDGARKRPGKPTAELANRCARSHHPHKDSCGGAHQVEIAARIAALHPRQAAVNMTRHHT